MNDICTKCKSPKKGRCQSCTKASKAAWYQRNAETLKARRAATYAEQPEASRQRRAAYYQANKEKIKARTASYAQQNPEKVKEYQLKKAYGISLEVFEQMNAQQGHVCQICGGPPTEKRGHLSVDHDHTTGRIRGLLCLRCNNLLGFALDSIDLLEKAKTYLERYRGQ